MLGDLKPTPHEILAFEPLLTMTTLIFILMSQVRACLWCLCGAVTRRSLFHKCSSFKTFHFQISFSLCHKALTNLIQFSATCLGNTTCRCLGNREMMLVTSNYFKVTGKCILKNRKEKKKYYLLWQKSLQISRHQSLFQQIQWMWQEELLYSIVLLLLKIK